MKKIPLTHGKFALVDDADFEWLNQWKWHLTTNGYAKRRGRENGKNIPITMHRLINATPEKLWTDHINGNRLDNQRSNLRSVNRSQNQANRKMNINNKSGYYGVFWYKYTHRWLASIKHKGRSIHIGYFLDKSEAAKAYNQKAKELQGYYATLNEII